MGPVRLWFDMPGQADPQEAIEVTSDGVMVRKSHLHDEFPVPTVGFEITSSRDEPVTVTIAERIPDGYSMDTIGFHAEYESDHWSAYQNRRIEFNREVDPDETVVTLYGVRTDDPSDIEAFMGPPRVTVSTAARDPHAHDGGVQETADLEGATEGDAPPRPAEPTIESVAERLAAELREGRVDEADREAIREELGLDLSAATEAQLRHLQTRVEDAIAYAEPVEAFLESGGPERVEEVADDMDDVRDAIEDLEAEVTELGEALDSLEEPIEDMEDRLDSLPEGLYDDGVPIEDLDAELETVRNQLYDLQHGLDDLQSNVDEIQRWREQLTDLFGDRE